MFSNHVTGNLSAYLHGELTSDEALRVQSHLNECAKCRIAYDEIRWGVRLASTLVEAKAPLSMWNDIQVAKEHGNRTRPAGLATGLIWASGLAVAVLAMGVFLRMHVPQGAGPTSTSSWEVTSVRGAPRIGSVRVTDICRLRPGDSLQTNASSEAQVKIADIGQLELDPNSRIRLISSNSDQHRIALERGKMTARTWSPPRLFVVETPTATAVDLGCIYSCEVQRDGSTLLHVTLGLVALDFHGRETIIPAGAFCRTRPGAGLGTPYFDDASERLQAALNDVDFGKNDAQRLRQLEVVLRESRARDTFTLWYLVSRLDGSMRGAVVDRMTALVPLPSGVTRAGVLALDGAMMDAWKDELAKVW